MYSSSWISYYSSILHHPSDFIIIVDYCVANISHIWNPTEGPLWLNKVLLKVSACALVHTLRGGRARVYAHVLPSSRNSLHRWNLRTGSATVRVRGLSSAEVGGQARRGRHETRRLSDTAVRPHEREGQRFAAAWGANTRTQPCSRSTTLSPVLIHPHALNETTAKVPAGAIRSHLIYSSVHQPVKRILLHYIIMQICSNTQSIVNWRACTNLQTNISQRIVGGVGICTPP